MARMLVVPIAAALHREQARIVLHVEESYRSEVMLRGLEAGELDAVFAPIVDELDGVEAFELARDDHVLAVKAEDPLARLRRPLAARDLRGRRVVSKDCGTPSQRMVEAALARLDVETQTVVRAHDGATVQELVAAGVGVAIMPRLLVDQSDPRIVFVPAGHLIPDRRLGVHARRDRLPTVSAVVDHARALASH
jgi:DNA-binding transcriptional LysR family regulator